MFINRGVLLLLMRSGNPVLKADAFTQLGARYHGDVMTVDGAVNRTFLLLLLLTLVAAFSWSVATSAYAGVAGLLAIIGAIVGFVFALITIFKKEWSAVTAPIYAVCEGLFLGALSAWFDAIYPGIVVQAVLLTFGVLFALLFLYKSRVIKVTERFRLGVFAATAGIALVYLISFIFSLFGHGFGFIHEGGMIGILFSLFVVVIAALNLVLDFDFIEKGAQARAPKYMEWFAAFGLMVTLVWLYLEILRLLAKVRGGRD